MAVLAGIDEAGFGPVLGPLVVSGAVFRLPDEHIDTCMWRLLEGTVRRTKSARKTLPLICDSKRAYSRKSARPLEHLERGVLGMLSAMNKQPDCLAALLGMLAPQAKNLLAEYPWYTDGKLHLPNCISNTEAKLVGNALKTGMHKAGIRLLDVRAEPVPAGQFNRLARATRNKSVMLMDTTARLLDRIWRNAPARSPVRIYVDHHGGRIRYLPHLQRIFPACRFKIIEENSTLSAYRISRGEKSAEIIFHVSADGEFLPVALASMISKYVRELFMTMFNDFWSRSTNQAISTSGYHVDGKEFYRKIKPAVARMDIDESLIYRIR